MSQNLEFQQESTSHKYHKYIPNSDHRQNLHVHYPTTENNYETEENYQFDKTVVEREQYKTSNSTVYQGRQKPEYEAQIKKAPALYKVDYVNDAELKKVISPPSLNAANNILNTSSTKSTYRDPAKISHPEFHARPVSDKTVGEKMPFNSFVAGSVTKTDFYNPSSNLASTKHTVSKYNNLNHAITCLDNQPITHQTMPPTSSANTGSLAPPTHKIYNISRFHNQDIEGRFKKTSDDYDWPKMKVQDVEVGQNLHIDSYWASAWENFRQEQF